MLAVWVPACLPHKLAAADRARVIALDLVIWAQHYVFHHVPVLWRLHRVHHADVDIDVTTGLRFHPLEILLSLTIKIAAVIALGVPVAAVIVFEVLLNATSMFNHSNVALPAWAEPVARWLVVTPQMPRARTITARIEKVFSLIRVRRPTRTSRTNVSAIRALDAGWGSRVQQATPMGYRASANPKARWWVSAVVRP